MRAGVCGMTAPGRPYIAAMLAWRDGEVSHANNGILGEVFNAVMTSLAFVDDDIRSVVRTSIQMIPKDSEYYSVISYAYDCCIRYENWQDALYECMDRYKKYNWIHAYPNACCEIIALIYGNGDEVAIYDLEAKTDDRTDFSVAFYDESAPLTGFCVRSRLGMMLPLLDGGRTANFKFEQTGVKFAVPTINKINAEGEEDDVISRMLMIERLGGVLKYNDVADKIFRSNLSMIDLHMGRLLAEMTRLMWLDGITKVSELTEAIKQLNPLKIKDELINKHGFYEYKIKEFLLALATGMRPAKLYNGIESAICGFLFVTGDGDVLCYQRAYRQVFADFLFYNSRLEKGSTEKDKYGYLERENGVYYFKLNLKIGLLKR